jgi:hypothetical protein
MQTRITVRPVVIQNVMASTLHRAEAGKAGRVEL